MNPLAGSGNEIMADSDWIRLEASMVDGVDAAANDIVKWIRPHLDYISVAVKSLPGPFDTAEHLNIDVIERAYSIVSGVVDKYAPAMLDEDGRYFVNEIIMSHIGDKGEAGLAERLSKMISELILKNSGPKEEKIKGGLADRRTLSEIADKHGVSVIDIVQQVEKGIKVEFEHTDDDNAAMEIVLDHLWESATYYDHLDEMESTMKKEQP